MKFTSFAATFAVTGALGGAAVGLAGPSSADELSGIYTVERPNVVMLDDGPAEQWTISPCGAGCATVTSAKWTANATLTGGRWNLAHPTFILCAGDFGTQHPATANASWDAATLAGTEVLTNPGVCGAPPGATMNTDFTLRKV